MFILVIGEEIMTKRVVVNGFGRIGKLVFRELVSNPNFDLVGVNVTIKSEPAKTLAYLLKYDSAQGEFKGHNIEVKDEKLYVDGKYIEIFDERDPANLPWRDRNIDIVVECTGAFNDKEKASKHLEAGAKKVVISAPAKGDLKTVVFGVNDEILTAEDLVVSGASCTTNCLAPVVKVLDDNFGIEKGLMTTVHAYTNDQGLADVKHKKGIYARRGRAAAQNIVPTSTGAAAAVGKVLPNLNGKLDGMALRVPTVTGSIVDLVVELKKDASVEEINAAMKAAANDTLQYTEDPIVSSDVVGNTHGSIFDALSTNVLEVEGKKLTKVLMWYDNEMSYVCQLIRLTEKVAKL